jgi:hypothetical protein
MPTAAPGAAPASAAQATRCSLLPLYGRAAAPAGQKESADMCQPHEGEHI